MTKLALPDIFKGRRERGGCFGACRLQDVWFARLSKITREHEQEWHARRGVGGGEVGGGGGEGVLLPCALLVTDYSSTSCAFNTHVTEE